MRSSRVQTCHRWPGPRRDKPYLQTDLKPPRPFVSRPHKPPNSFDRRSIDVRQMFDRCPPSTNVNLGKWSLTPTHNRFPEFWEGGKGGSEEEKIVGIGSENWKKVSIRTPRGHTAKPHALRALPCPPRATSTEARAWTYSEIQSPWQQTASAPHIARGEAPHLLYSRAVLTIYDSGPKALAPDTLCTHNVPRGLKICIEKIGAWGKSWRFHNRLCLLIDLQIQSRF